MDVNNLSMNGKKRLTRWIGQQTRKHNSICISRMVENAPNEHKLMQMMKYIDDWHLAHPQETHQEESGDLQENSDEAAPDVALKVEPETPVNPQKELSRHAKHRINAFILNHPGAPISEIVNSATDEDELLRTIEKMEKKVVPVDTRIKLWTCAYRRL